MTKKETIKRVNKKHQVIEELFKICKKKNNFEFHNDLVKDVCKKVGFGNPFDVTKLDNKTKLPGILVKNDYAIIHIGSGKHKFIKGIDKVFHDFEPIEKTIIGLTKISLLNQYNYSDKTNILSVANNHEFYITSYSDKTTNLMILILQNVQKLIFRTEQKHHLNTILVKKQLLR